MSNASKKPFIYYTTSLPSLPREPGLSKATRYIKSDVGALSPLSSPPLRKDYILDKDKDKESLKGSQHVSLVGYNKVLGDAIKLLVRFFFITVADHSEWTSNR